MPGETHGDAQLGGQATTSRPRRLRKTSAGCARCPEQICQADGEALSVTPSRSTLIKMSEKHWACGRDPHTHSPLHHSQGHSNRPTGKAELRADPQRPVTHTGNSRGGRPGQKREANADRRGQGMAKGLNERPSAAPDARGTHVTPRRSTTFGQRQHPIGRTPGATGSRARGHDRSPSR